jgi:predicted transcriptional regulator
VYTARAAQEKTQRQLAGDLLHRAFGGSAKNLVLGALSAQKVSAKELAEIHEMLARFEKVTR